MTNLSEILAKFPNVVYDNLRTKIALEHYGDRLEYTPVEIQVETNGQPGDTYEVWIPGLDLTAYVRIEMVDGVLTFIKGESDVKSGDGE